MKLKKYHIFLILPVIFLSLNLSDQAKAANLIVSSPGSAHQVGETFLATISVDPGADKIDTVRAKLVFSPEVLEIKNFSPGSAFTYQTGSNGFDNVGGTFSWGAGVPGGITSPVSFGTLTFLVKKEGQATVSISSDALLLSNGENKFSGQSGSLSFLVEPPLARNVSPKPVVKPIQRAEPQPVIGEPVAVNAEPIGEKVESKSLVRAEISKEDLSKRSFYAALIESGTHLKILAFFFIVLGLLAFRFALSKIKNK